MVQWTERFSLRSFLPNNCCKQLVTNCYYIKIAIPLRIEKIFVNNLFVHDVQKFIYNKLFKYSTSCTCQRVVPQGESGIITLCCKETCSFGMMFRCFNFNKSISICFPTSKQMLTEILLHYQLLFVNDRNCVLKV